MEPATISIEVEQALRYLIQNLVDGEKNLKEISEHLKGGKLKHYFAEESEVRAAFRQTLQELLHSAGLADIQIDRTIGGSMLSAWGSLMGKLGGSDLVLLQTAEQGENDAKTAYQKALNSNLPSHLSKILSEQYGHIEASYNHVKAERDNRM